MNESGEISPLNAAPAPRLLIVAGLAAAVMLGLLGLYQGFSLTWRDYPHLLPSAVSAMAAPAAQPSAITVADADTPTATPVSRRDVQAADDAPDAAAPPTPAAEPAAATAATSPANAADVSALAPATVVPASDPSAPPASLPPSPSQDDDAPAPAASPQ